MCSRSNFLALLEHHSVARTATVVAFRAGWDTGRGLSVPQRSAACSLVMDIHLGDALPASPIVPPAPRADAGGVADAADVVVAASAPEATFHAVGWERNVKGRMGPRMINLQAFLDPKVSGMVLLGSCRPHLLLLSPGHFGSHCESERRPDEVARHP